MNDRSIQALRDADPRMSTESQVDYDAIRNRIIASPVEEAMNQNGSRRWTTAGVTSLAVSVIGVGALVVALTLGAFGPLGRSGTQSAYAAVTKAVAKTIELGTSGTIVTSLQAGRSDGKPDEPAPEMTVPVSAADLGSTFTWNGDDFILAVHTIFAEWMASCMAAVTIGCISARSVLRIKLVVRGAG